MTNIVQFNQYHYLNDLVIENNSITEQDNEDNTIEQDIMVMLGYKPKQLVNY